MFLINGHIYTMEENTIENGFIHIVDDKIVSVQSMESFKNDNNEEVVDCKGAMVTPGFVESHCHLGMFEDGLTFEGDDGNEDTDPSTPNLRAIDAINVFDICFDEAIKAGVTTAVTGPGSANPIGGQFVALKTVGRRIDDMVIKEPVSMKMAMGENPKTTYNTKNVTPVTRMATAAIIRENLAKAKRYMEAMEDSLEDEDMDPPEYDAKCEALVPVLKGELPVQFHAHRTDDIFTAIRIAKEFNLDYAIIHTTEGHLIADILKKDNVKVMSGPFMTDRSKPELKNLTPASAGIMSKAGLKPSIVTDHPVTPIQYLPMCAGLAVSEGMDRLEALKAITIYPAEICHLEDKVGSLKKGKLADILVFNKDPLSIGSKPDFVMCHGEVIVNKL